MPLPATSKYIGVTTIGGHVARAIDFQSRTDVYVTLAKPTAWTDADRSTLDSADGVPLEVSDANPPLPNPMSTSLAEAVVSKKAVLNLVVPDATGPVIAYGQRWRPVSPAEARAVGSRWVLVSASFEYNEIPITAACSYLTAAANEGTNTLNLKNAAGYLVGDRVKLGGIDGQETTVQAVDTATNTVTVADALLVSHAIGTYITNLTNSDAFEYRQIGVRTHVTLDGGAATSPDPSPSPLPPGTLIVPEAYMGDSLLEYYYNTEPIPRKLNRRDGVVLILTF